jgi:hypothetical protein
MDICKPVMVGVVPSRERDVATTLPGAGNHVGGLCFVKKSRHLVLWSLENLTSLLEILRQGTGCVKGRF